MEDNTDFIARLLQIEEQAHSLGAEVHASLAKGRCRHIALLARTLRGRLELGAVSVMRTERGAPAAGPEDKPGRRPP